MKKYLPTALLIFSCLQSMEQVPISKDPEIAAFVSQVNADSLRSYVETLVGFGTRHTLSTGNSAGKGIAAARNWVAEKMAGYAQASGGRMKVSADEWIQTADGKRVDSNTRMANMLARLEGSDKTNPRVIMISAHLDSRVSDPMNRQSDAPGANDDASGVAAVIECARILSSHSFPASIIFVAFTGEEQGLLGSTHLAAEALRDKWNLLALLNNDIIGGNNQNQLGSTGNGQVRVFSEGIPAGKDEATYGRIRQFGLENDGSSRQLARYVQETGERYVDNLQVSLIFRNDRFLRGGDHSPFVEKGFPAIRLTEMNENFDHQHQDLITRNGQAVGDLVAYMDFEYLRKNTALNLACLANLAKAPPAPAEFVMDVSQLANTSSFSWKPAPSDQSAAGYYLLIRETSAAQWQKKFFVQGLQAVLPYPKDNYFFALQSVSAGGNESLPLTPTINR